MVVSGQCKPGGLLTALLVMAANLFSAGYASSELAHSLLLSSVGASVMAAWRRLWSHAAVPTPCSLVYIVAQFWPPPPFGWPGWNWFVQVGTVESSLTYCQVPSVVTSVMPKYNLCPEWSCFAVTANSSFSSFVFGSASLPPVAKFWQIVWADDHVVDCDPNLEW